MASWLIAASGPRGLLAALATGAALAAGTWLYLAGGDAARIDALEATILSVEKRNDVDRAIDRLPDGAAVDRL
ncbi:hypothetical protein ABTM07_19845, partial [Acinetobacter baumannii]